jgi:hypothetical protein
MRHMRKKETFIGDKRAKKTTILQTSLFEKHILPWYKSPYSGTIMVFLAISNLIKLPFHKYYESAEKVQGIQGVWILDTVNNFAFLIDLIIALIVIGPKKIFLGGYFNSIAECVFQVLFFATLRPRIDIMTTGNLDTFKENGQIFGFLHMAILFRLFRIGPFLVELE